MKIRIPIDVVWKIVTWRGRSYRVPDFRAMRNKYRQKTQWDKRKDRDRGLG